MAERDGRIDLAETLSEGQRQFVQGFVDRLSSIDGVSGVALLVPQDSDLRQALLWVIIPHCVGYHAIVKDPDVRAEVMTAIEEMRPLDGDFGYDVLTSFGAEISSGKAKLRRDDLVSLWQRSSG